MPISNTAAIVTGPGAGTTGSAVVGSRPGPGALPTLSRTVQKTIQVAVKSPPYLSPGNTPLQADECAKVKREGNS